MSTWREVNSAMSATSGLEPVELVGDESKPVVRATEAGVREIPPLDRQEPEPGRTVPAGLTEFQNLTEGVIALSILLGLSISTEE